MPSRDSTGAPLSGRACREQAARNREAREAADSKRRADAEAERELNQPLVDEERRTNERAWAKLEAADAKRKPGRPKKPASPPPCSTWNTPPPTTYADILLWAHALQAKCAALMSDLSQVPRARLVGQVLGCLAKLKGPGKDSECALVVHADLHEPIYYQQIKPPKNPLGVGMWAMYRLALLAHEMATAETSQDDAMIMCRAKALAAVGLLHPQSAFDDLYREMEKRRKN